jgi:hypothetical protein
MRTAEQMTCQTDRGIAIGDAFPIDPHAISHPPIAPPITQDGVRDCSLKPGREPKLHWNHGFPWAVVNLKPAL